MSLNLLFDRLFIQFAEFYHIFFDDLDGGMDDQNIVMGFNFELFVTVELDLSIG